MDAVRLDSPDWFALLKVENIHYVIVPYSMMGRLRKHDSKNALPRPLKAVLCMDRPFGKLRLPSGEFFAATPYGTFRVSSSPVSLFGKPADEGVSSDCTECHFSRWPCEKHIGYDE